MKELKGKKIAIIGLGASQIDYVIGVENSMQWDEVWCINSAISVFDCDRAFILDPMERFLDSDDAGAQTDVMRRVLPTFDKPIYSCGLDERVPAVVEYPLHEVMQEFKTAYFNNTAIALAVLDGEGGSGLDADFSVTNFTRNEPLEEAITVNVTVKPTYVTRAPTWVDGGGS